MSKGMVRLARLTIKASWPFVSFWLRVQVWLSNRKILCLSAWLLASKIQAKEYWVGGYVCLSLFTSKCEASEVTNKAKGWERYYLTFVLRL